MTLTIEEEFISSTTNFHPEAIFQKFPLLFERSKMFLEENSNALEIDCKENRLLYICQGELAAVSKCLNKANFKYIGSDDATTCHIVIMIEPQSNTISLGHFDGGHTEQGIYEMLQKVKNCWRMIKNVGDLKDIDLYIIGGFVDNKKYSERLFIEILSTCSKNTEFDIKLKLACVYSVNNRIINGQNYPVITGVFVDLESQEISAGHMRNYGPDLLLRHVRLLYGDKKNGFSDIYDQEAGYIYIEPFKFETPWYANLLLQLDDKEYLKRSSTSPHCEPPYFVKQSKSALLFALKYEEQINAKIFCSKSRRCILNDELDWVYLDKEHTALSL